jgi:LPXTG-motif cell wall-anchored protein
VVTLPMRTPDPALQPSVQAAAVQPAAVVEAETPAPVQAMPNTASEMPLLGLAGLVSLALFAALGFASRRRRPCKT